MKIDLRKLKEFLFLKEVYTEDLTKEYDIELPDFKPQCEFHEGSAVCECCRNKAFKNLLDNISNKVIEKQL